MFYLPFRFRDVTEPCKPMGPNFSRARKTIFRVNGTEVKLAAPKHRAGSHHDPTNPKRAYDLKSLHLPFSTFGDDRWRGLSIMRRVWDFYGPWFTGQLATCRMNVVISSPGKENLDVSYFHPRAFEDVVAQYLNYRYSDEMLTGGQKWLAPVEWQPMLSYPCNGVSFSVKPNKIGDIPIEDETRYLMFPVTDSHFIDISFHMTWSPIFDENDNFVPGTEHWIDTSEMHKLVSDIIDSVEITMSDEAKAQQKKALEELTDTSLAKDFPPLKWA